MTADEAITTEVLEDRISTLSARVKYLEKGRRRRFGVGWVGAAVLAGALVFTASGYAIASVPDSSGVIHGCYANTSPTPFR